MKTIVIGVSLIVALSTGLILYLNDINQPSFEDSLINMDKSGMSQEDLLTEVSERSQLVDRYFHELFRGSEANINVDFKMGALTAIERDMLINNRQKIYQTNVNVYKSIKAYQINYVQGKISAEELKEHTEPLYSQTEYLKEVHYASNSHLSNSIQELATFEPNPLPEFGLYKPGMMGYT